MRNTEAVNVRDLYERYGFMIYGRCLRILGCREQARDATQTVFLRLVEHLESVREPAKIVSWIFSTAQNHCFNLLRFRKRFADGIEPDMLATRGDWLKQFDARRMVTLLMDIRDRRVREAAYYTYVEELDQQEIYRLTGQSPATIRRNLKKFRDRAETLRKRWVKE
jgi:RNA polymerase sigma-70 factor (ECF subfamily)